MEVAVRSQIERFQEVAKHLPQTEMPVIHSLVNGMYAREIFIPRGTVFVGKAHKTDHFFIVLEGETMMTTDDGVKSAHQGEVFIVKAGSKRMGITHTDCRFITFHRTDQTELKAIVNDLVEFDPNGRYDEAGQVIELREPL